MRSEEQRKPTTAPRITALNWEQAKILLQPFLDSVQGTLAKDTEPEITLRNYAKL